MNARSSLRRQRRRLYICAALSLALTIGITSWISLPPPSGSPVEYRPVAYNSAKYGVKAEAVVAQNAPARPASDYSAPSSHSQTNSVPEPASLLLMAPALLLLRRRRA
jgi:hypothetical protein